MKKNTVKKVPKVEHLLLILFILQRGKKKTKEKKSTWKVCKSKFYERKCSHHILEDLKEEAYEKLSEVKKYKIKLPKNCVYQTINKLSVNICRKQKTFYSQHQQRSKNLFRRSLEQESRSTNAPSRNMATTTLINMELPTFMLLMIFAYMFTLNNLNGITSASQTIQGECAQICTSTNI